MAGLKATESTRKWNNYSSRAANGSGRVQRIHMLYTYIHVRAFRCDPWILTYRARAYICRLYPSCINRCRKEPDENTTRGCPENAIYMIIPIVMVHQNFRSPRLVRTHLTTIREAIIESSRERSIQARTLNFPHFFYIFVPIYIYWYFSNIYKMFVSFYFTFDHITLNYVDKMFKKLIIFFIFLSLSLPVIVFLKSSCYQKGLLNFVYATRFILYPLIVSCCNWTAM